MLTWGIFSMLRTMKESLWATFISFGIAVISGSCFKSDAENRKTLDNASVPLRDKSCGACEKAVMWAVLHWFFHNEQRRTKQDIRFFQLLISVRQRYSETIVNCISIEFNVCACKSLHIPSFQFHSQTGPEHNRLETIFRFLIEGRLH